MTDKELRKLDKGDLIEIIYRLRLNEDGLKDELAEMKDELAAARAEISEMKVKLADRELNIRSSGSIAEAVVKLNGLFETAQKTADDYIEQVRKNAGAAAANDVDAECARRLADTEEKCRRREAECDRQIKEKWAHFREEAGKFIEQIRAGNIPQ